MNDEGRMMKNDEGWMKNDEGWRKNDEGWWFQAVEGFWFMTDRRTNKWTDNCDCRVAFATENIFSITPCFILTDSSDTVKCWIEWIT